MAHPRPPRAPPSRSGSTQPLTSPTSPTQRPGHAHGVSFNTHERGQRTEPLASEFRSPTYTQNPLPPTPSDLAGMDNTDIGRKKSLVRPDREKIGPGHRHWHYRSHAAQLEEESHGRVGILPSTTGNLPTQQPPLRRGKSLLAREEDYQPESGLSIFKRGATLRRRKQAGTSASPEQPSSSRKKGIFSNIAPGPIDAWMIYCFLLTCCVPSFLLSSCGYRTPERQRAWREKIGLLGLITSLMAGVGFLTFGFTRAVCGTPPTRFQTGTVNVGNVIIHGYDYDLNRFNHPPTAHFETGNTNPTRDGPMPSNQMDVSFLFQKPNDRCRGFVGAASNSSITNQNNLLGWVFPCNAFPQAGPSTINFTGYDSGIFCHTGSASRQQLAQMKPQGQVYYKWSDVKAARNLAVYQSSVLNLDLLNWLSPSQVVFPNFFNELRTPNGTFNGLDMTMYIYRTNQKAIAACLQDLVTVGFIDTNTIGCVASEVVLVVSLVFIIGVVAIKFGMAVLFGWFLSWRLGSFRNESYEARMRRAAEIEQWTDDIYRPAPGRYRPNVLKGGVAASGKGGKKNFIPSTSRFSKFEGGGKGGMGRPATGYGNVAPLPYRKSQAASTTSTLTKPSMYSSSYLSPGESPGYRDSQTATTLNGMFVDSTCPFPLQNVVPQPPIDYEPFGYPLKHTICLVTAYSESIEGLRTTLDSVAQTDYPNSHKLIMVIADGMVKGAGNSLTTPEIILSMMKEFVVPPEEVEAHSYVAIADGHKRHNMAKVFAGYYEYDDNTVEMSKQQRVPMILVAKVGNPLEARDAKPGNRGKRDSQIVLMGFLQKVMFDERMTTFEYEFFNSIWRATGVSPDRYELVLCVDADTKVFPDSLTRMVACMSHDDEIMGLCGETKIANKAETWVTMIQVFEYYISHHMTKAFESMFGGVTCLPGCFSMYRIKAPKAESGYWVPVLANPDIVEHYSENVVDTLHKKNLLLLGEDRYLTTLLLKTFPKRKLIFCPQAVCKTIVPDTFGVLLSQRRRWINSTVHNLAELLFVRDLCGTFCFSMQFVVFMELAGTLVLPAAISFTIYLIVISIIPHQTSTVIPLVLLGIILGLPGLLIVVTTRKLAYVGWMLVYLLSLPIWNFVLPVYAYWHFDDFSWGATRKTIGDVKSEHTDKEGEFDSSHIVMKRWAEFERERRWKNGSQSRDSYLDATRDNSPKRYSLISSADTFHLGQQGYGTPPSVDSDHSVAHVAPLLALPQPLGIGTRNLGSPASYSTSGISRTSEEGFAADQSNVRLMARESYSSDGSSSPPPAATDRVPGAVLRQGTVSTAYPGETQNPYRHSQPYAASPIDDSNDFFDNEPASQPMYQPQNASRAPSRGVSLFDPGPVGGQERVRRVSRQGARRPTATSPSSQPYSPSTSPFRNSGSYGLPPGAAPPRSQDYHGSS